MGRARESSESGLSISVVADPSLAMATSVVSDVEGTSLPLVGSSLAFVSSSSVFVPSLFPVVPSSSLGSSLSVAIPSLPLSMEPCRGEVGLSSSSSHYKKTHRIPTKVPTDTKVVGHL